jgi:hypothetical protein
VRKAASDVDVNDALLARIEEVTPVWWWLGLDGNLRSARPFSAGSPQSVVLGAASPALVVKAS